MEVIDYRAFEKVVEAIESFVEMVKEAWGKIKSMFTNRVAVFEEYFEMKQQIESNRSSWIVRFDTRRVSQVILNKPRNIVRKVIK